MSKNVLRVEIDCLPFLQITSNGALAALLIRELRWLFITGHIQLFHVMWEPMSTFNNKIIDYNCRVDF